MKSRFYLLLLLFYTAISRLFLLFTIPQMVNSSIATRILSSSSSLASAFFLFFLSQKYFKNTKISLISVWFFVNLPWVFVEGRIVSQPNIALFFILITILFAQKISSRYKYIFLVLILPILYLAYPQFWLFKMQEFKLSPESFITNLYILFSFNFLFFNNITYWWGGIREFGVMFLSFIPFFIPGLYRLIISKEIKLLILLLLVTIIAALSPYFPESREFYIATPIISYILALGAYYLTVQKNKTVIALLLCLFIFMIYELSQFYHFYFIHYPQTVAGNVSKIHESF